MKTKPDRRPDSQGNTMQRLLDAVGIDPTAPKPTLFTLESPLPEQGNDRTYMAHTDKMWVFSTSMLLILARTICIPI
jgi:hypothetical protein